MRGDDGSRPLAPAPMPQADVSDLAAGPLVLPPPTGPSIDGIVARHLASQRPTDDRFHPPGGPGSELLVEIGAMAVVVAAVLGAQTVLRRRRANAVVYRPPQTR